MIIDDFGPDPASKDCGVAWLAALPEPAVDRLSNILEAFNERFGNIAWSDADRLHRLITEDSLSKMAADAPQLRA